MKSEWETHLLGDLCDKYQGLIQTGPFGSQLHQHDYIEDGTPVVMPKDIVDNRVSTQSIARVSSENVQRLRKHKLCVGDVILPRRGEISKNALVTPVEKGFLCGTGCLKIVPPRILDSKYFSFLLGTKHVIGWLEGNAVGATMLNLSGSILKRLPVHFPPLPIQQKIAHILSAYDDLIENNLKRIKLLEDMAQITYEQWFVRMKFPGYEATSIDVEAGLPEAWERTKVGNLLAKVKVTKKIKSSESLEEGSVPIIDQSRNFIAGYTDDEDAIIESPPPLIVFGDHTRILKFVNFTFARGADGTQVIMSNDKKMPQHLFYFSLLAIDLSDYHYARHFKFLKECEVTIPCIEVANKFEDKAKTIFDGITLLRNQNIILAEARDILLPRLMTGMINVDHIELPIEEQDTEAA